MSEMPPTVNDENTAMTTPVADRSQPVNRRVSEIGAENSGIQMSPKQEKLLGRLHELMQSFKALKNRVKTIQASGEHSCVMYTCRSFPFSNRLGSLRLPILCCQVEREASRPTRKCSKSTAQLKRPKFRNSRTTTMCVLDV